MKNFRSRSRACSPSTKHIVENITPQEDKQETMNKEDISGDVLISTSPSISLDLNLSINDDDDEINGIVTIHSIDENGLLASVDKCIIFENKHEFLWSFLGMQMNGRNFFYQKLANLSLLNVFGVYFPLILGLLTSKFTADDSNFHVKKCWKKK